MFNPLDYPIVFQRPYRLKITGWAQHTPFAMFLMQTLKPKLFVELGTHWGTSYCAFCQSVKFNMLDTRCYAVDTWEGDSHVGFYGDQILEDLRTHHDLLYSDFSNLLRMTFDDAALYFEGEQIDLLHIDGYHTYEAVKHDFTTWLPMLGKQGIVLLHDISVREREFGVWRFWNELKEEYPTFEFHHGSGLGMVAGGGGVPEQLRMLFEAPDEERHKIQTFFASAGLHVDTVSILQERNQEVKRHQAAKDQQDTEYQQAQTQIEHQQNQITRLNAHIEQLEAQAQHTTQRHRVSIEQQRAEIRTQQAEIRQQQEQIVRLKAQLREADELQAAQQKYISEVEEQLQHMKDHIERVSTYVDELEGRLATLQP